MEENFTEGNGWKFHGQSAAGNNAAFYCFHKLRSQAVAIIESAGGRSYPDDGSAKHRAGVTHRLGKRSAQVTGKIRIPVTRESFIQIIFRLHGMSQRRVPDDRIPSLGPQKALCERLAEADRDMLPVLRSGRTTGEPLIAVPRRDCQGF